MFAALNVKMALTYPVIPTLMICLHTQLHLPISNVIGLLVSAKQTEIPIQISLG
jgi:hypothetical protein